LQPFQAASANAAKSEGRGAQPDKHPRQSKHQHDYFCHPLAGVHYHSHRSRHNYGRPRDRKFPPANRHTNHRAAQIQIWAHLAGSGGITGIYSSLTIESGLKQAYYGYFWYHKR
jgi:hypothetical protein